MTNSNLQLIDTHAHLYMDDFIENLDKVILKAISYLLPQRISFE